MGQGSSVSFQGMPLDLQSFLQVLTCNGILRSSILMLNVRSGHIPGRMQAGPLKKGQLLGTRLQTMWKHWLGEVSVCWGRGSCLLIWRPSKLNKQQLDFTEA